MMAKWDLRVLTTFFIILKTFCVVNCQIYSDFVLDPYGRYLVSWEVDMDFENVTFSLVVETQGYVGFGISKNGTMLGADMVVAEFDETKEEVIFQVFYLCLRLTHYII